MTKTLAQLWGMYAAAMKLDPNGPGVIAQRAAFYAGAHAFMLEALSEDPATHDEARGTVWLEARKQEAEDYLWLYMEAIRVGA